MRITLTEYSRSKHGLFFHFSAGQELYSTTYWYHDVDLIALEQKYGAEFLERIYLHIGAFELNKLASLNAKEITFGPLAHLVTEPFIQLWTSILHGVWSQWRFENDLPNWLPPTILDPPIGPSSVWEPPYAHEKRYLAYFGGGKDSLLVQSLLAQLGCTFSSFQYAGSAYGRPELQFDLLANLQRKINDVPVHRLTTSDDFYDAPLPLLAEEHGIKSITAAETPSSIFSAQEVPEPESPSHTDLRWFSKFPQRDPSPFRPTRRAPLQPCADFRGENRSASAPCADGRRPDRPAARPTPP